MVFMDQAGAPDGAPLLFPVFDCVKEFQSVVGRKKIKRIQRYVVAPDLEMKMISRGNARASDQAHDLALAHEVPLFYEICRKMGVSGDEVVPVFDIDSVAEAGKVYRTYHAPFHGSAHWFPEFGRDVHSEWKRPPAKASNRGRYS
jgi:hypothetical protein